MRPLLLLFFLALTSSAAPRPNVVLVLADDQGWGETGYHGHPRLRTPVLDEMAASGLRFNRFYSAAPNCSPTRASILTGRHPNRSGVFAPNHSTRPEEITIAQILRRAGYRTGHFGKWHVGAVKAASPTNPAHMGYEEYLAHDNFFEMNPPLSRNGADPTIIQGESSQICVDAAVEFLRKVRVEGDAPFFVTLWFGSPHSPYSGLPDDVALYADEPGKDLRRRFAEITAMDRAIGRFREALREMGEADDTLLWYTSDNGVTIEGVPEDQRGGLFNGVWRGHKGDLYEGGLRVPAIIEWPAVVAEPRSTDVPAVTTDMFATLLGLLELRHPDPDRPLDGWDLSPVIRGEAVAERPSPIGFWRYDKASETGNERWMDAELTHGTTPTTRNPGIDFVNYKHPVAKTEDFGGVAAWTGNRYKLVRFGSKPPELYDLLADPAETTNLAAKQPERVRSMLQQLTDWQRSVEVSLTGADY
ncbi:MAG: sulfatase-like hydrolase/transferase [Acidobacteria bacterium]|nr:sulfatase-like hydrolase/transferase [Acidobacteriota bacterium]